MSVDYEGKREMMSNTFLKFIIGCVVISISCVAYADSSVNSRLAGILKDAGVQGVIVVQSDSGQRFISDEALAQYRRLPASTYKMLHSLIALDTGIVDAHERIAWDGVDRRFTPWNRDQTLESAIRNSTVWVFQRFAKAIGRDRMRNYLQKVGYGNNNPGGALDSFWLDGDLRISPLEQLAFVKRLRSGDLPFSREHMDIVHSCLLLETGDGWALYAKTGWAARVDPEVGWLVGWYERQGRVWYFATCIEIRENSHSKLRFDLTRKALKLVGAME